jgi:hypothetical protein
MDAGKGINRIVPDGGTRTEFILDWISALSARLRNVRVACGDWSRVIGESVTTRNGLTGVFLDPPYGADADRKPNLYRTDCLSVAGLARQWAIDNGNDPLLRIAFAGYDGEHDFPADWQRLAWKAAGGYGSQGKGRGRENSSREMLWFSPNCLRGAKTADLFDFAREGE